MRHCVQLSLGNKIFRWFWVAKLASLSPNWYQGCCQTCSCTVFVALKWYLRIHRIIHPWQNLHHQSRMFERTHRLQSRRHLFPYSSFSSDSLVTGVSTASTFGLLLAGFEKIFNSVVTLNVAALEREKFSDTSWQFSLGQIKTRMLRCGIPVLHRV